MEALEEMHGQPSIAHSLDGQVKHPYGVLIEQGIVLDEDQGVAGLFENGHELKDDEGSADLQILEPGSQACTALLNTLIAVNRLGQKPPTTFCNIPSFIISWLLPSLYFPSS
jgi:hypothetical protein